MSAPVRYWVDAAREQSRWYRQLRAQARAERNGRRCGALWGQAFRCRDRKAPFMAQARAARAALAGGAA